MILVSPLAIGPVYAANITFGQEAHGLRACCSTGGTAIPAITITTDKFLVVQASTQGAGAFTISATDTQANTFTNQKQSCTTGTVICTAELTATASAGADTITVSTGTDSALGIFFVTTWANVDHFVIAQSDVHTSAATAYSTTFTSLGKTEAIIGGLSYGNSPGITPGPGQTSITGQICNPGGHCGDVEYVSPTGAVSWNFQETLAGGSSGVLSAVVLIPPAPPPSFPTDLLWVKSLAAVIMIGFLILPAYRWKNHQGGAGNAPSFVELAVDTVIVCGAFLVIIGAL